MTDLQTGRSQTDGRVQKQQPSAAGNKASHITLQPIQETNFHQSSKLMPSFTTISSGISILYRTKSCPSLLSCESNVIAALQPATCDNPRYFCRAMLCKRGLYVVMRCPSVRLCVCVCVCVRVGVCHSVCVCLSRS